MSTQLTPSCTSLQETPANSIGEPCDSTTERTSVEQMDMEPSSCSEKSVCTFYLEGKCRFGEDCFNLHPEGVAVVEKKGSPKEERKKKNGKRKKTHLKTEKKEEHGKKPSMKTAGDVRKRIQWDSDLRKEYFVVGYLDRFTGVVEKPFTAFTWEHLAAVDIDQFSIPQHRIQYFKYRGVKVWDKNERVDNVFGSTGSNVTIQNVMQEVDEELERKRQTYDSDDSDSDDTSAVKEAVQAQKQEYDRLRASHFLCIRVYNEELKNFALEVQEKIIEQEPVLRSCAMPAELLHVTLALIRIDGPEGMSKLVGLLQDLRPKLQELVAEETQSQILAKGLSTFIGARVLYCKLQVPEAFSSIVEMLHQSLEKIEGVVITDQRDFIPHMTLMKVNRVIARERGSEYINSILYSDYVDREFGFIPINNINLCNTGDERGHDGFYLTCEKIQL
ncbi:leukocyte receptor cluster member 9-like [Macrobrachium rosenbergii]|uniref:leukocyte receptor cluster member 9-like n=1 Tax=Macrobrachium rosenbergii TaxID=79674 RepID=UPI0034D5B30F